MAKGAKTVSSPQAALVESLAQAAFATMAVLSKVGSENSLSLTQLRALGILRGRRPRMAALAEHLGLEKSTMSGLVDRAEERGLLARAPSAEDGRAIEVFLTPKGAAATERLFSEVQTALSPLTSRLSPADQERLQTLLDRMLRPPADSRPRARRRR
jgi:DNA-binding MarR family transcriptional regulator